MHEHTTEQFIIRLDKGEEILSSLIDFCDQNEITGGWISGLGALSFATLANYDLSAKTYSRKDFAGKFELLNLTGNIAKLDDKTMAHIHATISNENMEVYGGHLERGVVAATCEIFLNITHTIKRKFDEEIGLNLIKG
jgi:predicted DNA-binding protein with PD1-like motif